MCAATVDSTRQSGGSGRQGDWRQRANEVMQVVAANHGSAEQAEIRTSEKKKALQALQAQGCSHGCAEQAAIRASEKIKAAVAKHGSVEQAMNAAMRALTKHKEAATTDKESATTDKDKEAATTDKKVAATDKKGEVQSGLKWVQTKEPPLGAVPVCIWELSSSSSSSGMHPDSLGNSSSSRKTESTLSNSWEVCEEAQKTIDSHNKQFLDQL
jgi:hypothetical protein